MKKLLLLTFILLLAACGSGEDEVEIPIGANVAVCPQGDTFKYIYKDGIVYEFYSNDVLQSDDMKAIVQTAADTAGSVNDYLFITFAEGVCTFTDYTPDTKG